MAAAHISQGRADRRRAVLPCCICRCDLLRYIRFIAGRSSWVALQK